MKLDGLAFEKLEFDLPNRKLYVYHTSDVTLIESALMDLNLGAAKVKTEKNHSRITSSDHRKENRLLWTVLWINFCLFAIEITTGFVSSSMGLVADSLDMLADAIVYGLSLYAVGHATSRKKRIAKISGYFQMTLAVLGVAEVIRRFSGYDDVPHFQTMIGISLLALTGNAISLYLLQKSKSQEAHMKASMIFTSNDVIVNIGVIIAGSLVYLTNSRYPDLIIGTIVFVIVARGAVRILKLAR